VNRYQLKAAQPPIRRSHSAFLLHTCIYPPQEQDFYDKSPDSPHRYLIERQTLMVQWQVLHTPGYLGAVLSTYRNFPMRSMDELFTAIGRHPRPTLSVWGDRDAICAYKKCMKVRAPRSLRSVVGVR
jgi:hypothetical protein